jgi:asparagine synthase (glutamine-hydrolysing)
MKINGTTEKYVLREAARPVLTETVYKRRKHTFVSPSATIQQGGRLDALLQDTLRGAALDGPGIYDRAKVRPLLDAVPAMDAQRRSLADPLMIWMTGLCLLGQQFGL